MITMHTEDAANVLNAQHRGQDTVFASMHNDTRKLQGGELYVAIRGEKLDGHQYLDQAKAGGAKAVLVDHEVNSDLPQIICEDTVNAMGRLAGHWRDRFDVMLIALTGSNGKTTVKEMLASIFRQKGRVHVTQGNLNNHIGVPLTLAGLEAGVDTAIIEMGANHPGEIGYLCTIAKPRITLINNAAAAHLEGFGSLDGVAQTKGEIFSSLTAGGTGILNADDHYSDYWRGLLKGKSIVSFGMEQAADIRCEYHPDVRVPLAIDVAGEQIQVHLPLPGRHNAMNALAATACAYAAGISPAHIKAGLENVQPVQGRMQVLTGLNGAVVINDSYNANPASLNAAVQWLGQQPGEKWLVLGDMFELGADAESLHRQAGRDTRDAGVDKLFGLGEFAAAAVAGFGSGGATFADYDSLIAHLKSMLGKNITVLVKGSRGMHMETVVDRITTKG